MAPGPANEGVGLSRLKVNTIEMAAPAKVNLFLKITGKRADGYHELLSVFVPVALYDQLTISRAKEGLEVCCSGKELPKGPANLVNRAATTFFKETGIKGGARISLIKRIPIASGLGGGSSDAAATLKGLNWLYGKPLGEKDIERLALSLGADVPFFLLQKPALARGIGEILEPIENFPDLWYIIISPQLMISSEWAYNRVNLKLTGNSPLNIMKFFRVGACDIPTLLFNDLESVALSKYPFLCSIKASLTESGALGALMSGSGPSIFGLFDSTKKAHEAGKLLVRRWIKEEVFIVKGLT
jgi:4-diphosphocytidyl-2-C-methyl-D-erythritol kinase